MSTTPGQGEPPPDAAPSSTTSVYEQVQDSEDFSRLRGTFRRFAFPMTAGFCAWYLLYVLMSNYAPGFMGKILFGNVNVAFVFGVLQFLSTFTIAWWYASFAGKRLDEQAERIRCEVEGRTGTAAERAEAVR